MSTYEPGQVAVATVRGVERVRVLRQQADGFERWICADFVPNEDCGPTLIAYDRDVTDIRPLVVLDLAHPEDAVAVLKTAADDFEIGVAPGKAFTGRGIYREIARQIAAQTKPPRIAEPGLWGVVEASLPSNPTRVEFVCTKHGWTRIGGTVRETDDFAWESLIDPTLIREGVKP